MSIADILDKAADLIEPEGKWGQGAGARDADGRRVLPNSPCAVRFCADGAIARAAPDWQSQQTALSTVQRLLRVRLWVWNDRDKRTQAEVVAKLREAAAKAREQGL